MARVTMPAQWPREHSARTKRASSGSGRRMPTTASGTDASATYGVSDPASMSSASCSQWSCRKRMAEQARREDDAHVEHVLALAQTAHHRSFNVPTRASYHAVLFS